MALVLAILMLIGGAGGAAAEPITIALFGSAFASTFLGSVVTFLFTATLALGASLLANALKPKQQAQQASQAGIQFDVTMGDNTPIAFTVGTTATAGTRKYIGTWGQDGSTPNAYLTDVIQIGDIPAPGQPGLWVNGQKCTIEWEAAPAPQGYPVAEFRVNGRDHLWVRHFDGTQTDADPFLVAKFGLHPERPYKTTMVGRGCPYLVITALFNRELFNGNLSYLAEPPATPWYDVRLDSTAGGDGDHRWNDPSTWAPTSNPLVIAYNVMRGVYYSGEWVYGGQNLAAFRLPAANFVAAANECDADRELEGGETEPQFRCGMEIRGDMEPLDVLADLMKSCSGRLAEVGGIFKVLVGAPGSAIYSFTDGDILVTRGQTYTPFPRLGETHNGIEATYPEPAEMWEYKDAPARYSSELESADDNRRLPAPGIKFDAVPFAIQVQQLMRAMIEEARRFRQHSFHLPPDAYVLEPNDVVAWTSTRNGYLNKKFLILKITGARTSNQLVLLKEIDVTDYGLPIDEQVPVSTGHISIVRPPAQPMAGWQAFPATIDDEEGARRPSIRVQYDGNQDDVRAVQVQARLAAQPVLTFDGEQPYGPAAAGIKSAILNGVFVPETAYEARGKFVPYSGRPTEWSEWLAVMTPDVKFTQRDFAAGLRDYITRELPAQIAAVDFRAQRIAANAAEQDAANELANRTVRTLLQAQGVTISETAQIALGIDGKLTGAVFNTIDNNGFVSGTIHYNDGTTAPFTVVATEFNVAAPGVNGGEPVPLFKVSTSDGEANVVIRGNIIGDGEIKAYHMEVAELSTITADCGTLTAGKVQSADEMTVFDLDAGALTFYREV